VLSALGIKPQAGAISYCNTGHMAAGAWFVLSEIMQIDGVRLYDGSMHEWTTLGRPVVGLGL
jgi:thiosulfate/3-mercaptopyruvate sulfurtransferase